MLFLVISTPQPARPDEVKGARTKFRKNYTHDRS